MPELLLPVHGRRQHLVAPLGIFFVVIQPDRARIALSLEHHSGARLDVQHGFLPMYAIPRLGIAGGTEQPSHVPHTEPLDRRLPPHPVAEHHGRRCPTLPVPGLIRLEHRIGRGVFRVMESSLEGSFLDEKIVNEQLPAHIDGNHLRRPLEIWHRRRLSRQRFDRRPVHGQEDAIAEHFPLGLLAGRGRKTPCYDHNQEPSRPDGCLAAHGTCSIG